MAVIGVDKIVVIPSRWLAMDVRKCNLAEWSRKQSAMRQGLKGIVCKIWPDLNFYINLLDILALKTFIKIYTHGTEKQFGLANLRNLSPYLDERIGIEKALAYN